MEPDAQPATTGPASTPKTTKSAGTGVRLSPDPQPDHHEKSGLANLECVLADGGRPEPGKVFHFRSDLKNVASLLAAGIDAVSLANNHVLDYGAEAFRETLPALDTAGILHAGAGTDKDAARRPAVLRLGAAAVGFLAFTDNEPGWAAGESWPGIHYVPVDDERKVANLLDLVRRTKP